MLHAPTTIVPMPSLLLISDDPVQTSRPFADLLAHYLIQQTTAGQGVRVALSSQNLAAAIVDLAGQSDNLRLIQDLNDLLPSLPLLVLTSDRSVEAVVALMQAGAGSVVGKPCSGREVAEQLARLRQHSPKEEEITSLAARERQVFDLLGDGCSASEIAARLGINVKTVEGTIIRLRSKLGSPNTAILRREAVQRKRRSLVLESIALASLAQGHEGIDGDHSALLLIAKRIEAALVRRAMTGELLPIVDELLAAAKKHGGNEEALMQAFSFPDIERHLAEHHALIEEIAYFRDSIAAGEPNENAFHAFVSHWYINHIEVSDRKLVAFMRSCEAATAMSG